MQPNHFNIYNMKYKIDFIESPSEFSLEEMQAIKGGGWCFIRIGCNCRTDSRSSREVKDDKQSSED